MTSETKNLKIEETDLHNLTDVFTMARGYAANTQPQNRMLMAHLLNFETSISEKLLSTFSPEEIKAMQEKSEAKETEETEELKEFKDASSDV